jgi:hypothetical protein
MVIKLFSSALSINALNSATSSRARNVGGNFRKNAFTRAAFGIFRSVRAYICMLEVMRELTNTYVILDLRPNIIKITSISIRDTNFSYGRSRVFDL